MSADDEYKELRRVISNKAYWDTQAKRTDLVRLAGEFESSNNCPCSTPGNAGRMYCKCVCHSIYMKHTECLEYLLPSPEPMTKPAEPEKPLRAMDVDET